MTIYNKKLIIVGNTAFAEIAHEYFSKDSPYEVAAFSVNKEFIKENRMCELPVVPFETLEQTFDPAQHNVFVATTYTQLNRLRERLCKEAKDKGFGLASYVSSHAFVWGNVTIGENCFIFENNVVQPFVTIGNNTILWSGNHIGHHSKIGNHVFFASHVVLSGYCEVKDYCFFGVNATIANNLVIEKDCLIGAGATILKSTKEDHIYGEQMTESKEKSARAYFKVEDH